VIPTTPFNNVTGKYDQQIHIRRNEIQFIRDLSTDCEFETVHCFSSTRCILHMGSPRLRVTFPLNVQLLRNESVDGIFDTLVTVVLEALTTR
jgi:hypothetical protein